MSKRLFLGFPVSVGSSLETAIKRVKIGSDRREIDLEWAPPANYHVTLNFLGNTPLEKIDDIVRVVEQVTQEQAPFSTSLRGFGAFPDEHHMRCMWVGVRKSRALNFLQSSLAAALEEIGFEPEARDYVPHLTVARTRKSRSSKDLLSPYVRTSFDDLEISQIALYESVLHGPRPVYEVVRTFELQGSQDLYTSDYEPMLGTVL